MTDFEREDMELKAIMGDRFHDDTAAAQNTAKATSKNQRTAQTERTEQKPAPQFVGKLKQAAKDACVYVILSVVLFWWQQSGRLEETTAWYSLLVCIGMVGFSVGKNWRGGVK